MNRPLSPSPSCSAACEWYQCVPGGHARNVYVIVSPAASVGCAIIAEPSKYGVPTWWMP